jgi:hypothetical protein
VVCPAQPEIGAPLPTPPTPARLLAQEACRYHRSSSERSAGGKWLKPRRLRALGCAASTLGDAAEVLEHLNVIAARRFPLARQGVALPARRSDVIEHLNVIVAPRLSHANDSQCWLAMTFASQQGARGEHMTHDDSERDDSAPSILPLESPKPLLAIWSAYSVAQ